MWVNQIWFYDIWNKMNEVRVKTIQSSFILVWAMSGYSAKPF